MPDKQQKNYSEKKPIVKPKQNEGLKKEGLAQPFYQNNSKKDMSNVLFNNIDSFNGVSNSAIAGIIDTKGSQQKVNIPQFNDSDQSIINNEQMHFDDVALAEFE